MSSRLAQSSGSRFPFTSGTDGLVNAQSRQHPAPTSWNAGVVAVVVVVGGLLEVGIKVVVW